MLFVPSPTDTIKKVCLTGSTNATEAITTKVVGSSSFLNFRRYAFVNLSQVACLIALESSKDGFVMSGYM